MNRTTTRIHIADNLEWLRTTGPNHIAAIAIEQAQLDHQARPPKIDPNTTDRGYRIGHADPTARTALPAPTPPTPTSVTRYDRDLHEIHGQARNLNHTTARALGHEPTEFEYEHDRYGLVSNALAYLPPGFQLDQAADQLHGHQLNHLDWLIRDLDDRVTLAITRATSILEASPGATPAEQQDLAGCKSHARFTALDGQPLWAMVDPRYRDLCTDCGQFRDKRKFLPDEPIIRGWDYGRHPSAADIERARRAAKIKPGRSKVA